MSKKTKLLLIAFSLLLLLGTAATVLLMPKENVLAYRGETSIHCTREGMLTVRLLNEDGEELEGGQISVQVLRYAEEPTDNEPSVDDGTTTVPIVNAANSYYDNNESPPVEVHVGSTVGCDYLDLAEDEFFSYPNENRARIIINQTAAPEDYRPIDGPIQLEYAYENTSGGPTIFDEDTSLIDRTQYALQVSVSGGSGQAELGTWAGYGNTTNYVLTLINTRDIPSGNLKLEKTIAGDGAETDKSFDFTVILTNAEGAPLANKQCGSYKTNAQGEISLSLKGGEDATIKNIPADTNYTVAEADYSQEGYTTTKENDSGTIEVDKTATASFTNTKERDPETPPDEPGEDTPEVEPGETDPPEESAEPPKVTKPDTPKAVEKTQPAGRRTKTSDTLALSTALLLLIAGATAMILFKRRQRQ